MKTFWITILKCWLLTLKKNGRKCLLDFCSLVCLSEMSDISEKEWKEALTSILEELDTSEYRKMLECLEKIPKSQKTGRSREKMPQKIIQRYGLEGSISAIRDAMEQIPRRDSKVQDLLCPFVDKLRKKPEEENKGEFIHKSFELLVFYPCLTCLKFNWILEDEALISRNTSENYTNI